MRSLFRLFTRMAQVAVCLVKDKNTTSRAIHFAADQDRLLVGGGSFEHAGWRAEAVCLIVTADRDLGVVLGCCDHLGFVDFVSTLACIFLAGSEAEAEQKDARGADCQSLDHDGVTPLNKPIVWRQGPGKQFPGPLGTSGLTRPSLPDHMGNRDFDGTRPLPGLAID
jgi:hypothetical protein